MKKKMKEENLTLYCVRCKADFTASNEKKYFPLTCPSCHRDTHWTKTKELDDNDDYWKKYSPTRKYFNPEGNFIPQALGEEILTEKHLLTTHDNKELFIYNDGHYHPNADERIRGEIQKRLGKKTRTLYKNETLDYIKSATLTDRKNLGLPINQINVQNGILDIETGELIEHTPTLYSTIQLPIHYDPTAQCPHIEKFIEEVLPPENIPLMQELMGYCLYCDYPYQKAFMLIGEGANGKSTLLQLITTMLGKENVSSISLYDLITRPFSRAYLYNKLANICPELSKGRLTHTGIFKMLTGGDIITAEVKFKNPFNFNNHAKLIFSANEVPETGDDSDAYYRRWELIDFPNKFEGKKADKRLLTKLTTREELSGLLNYSLEGLHRLLKNDEFTDSKTTEEIREQYTRMSSPVHAFAQDCLVEESDTFTPKDILYNTFVLYCREKKYPTVAKNVFARKLNEVIPIRETQPTIKGKRVHAWAGVRLKDELAKLENDRLIENWCGRADND